MYPVRINSVYFCFLFLVSAFLAGSIASGQADSQIDQAVRHVSVEASEFWHSAPGFTAKETLKQKAIVPPRRRLRARWPASSDR